MLIVDNHLRQSLSTLSLLLVLPINNEDLILSVPTLGPQDTRINLQRNVSLLYGWQTPQWKHAGLGNIHSAHTL